MNKQKINNKVEDSLKSYKNQPLLLKDFIVLKKLRSGNFGKVYACYNRKTLEKYAIKVINKDAIVASNILSYV